MDSLDEGVRTILEANMEFLTLLDSGKIQCTLNQHTMPARLEPLQKFVGGAKFARMKKERISSSSLKQYEPFLIPSRLKLGFLFCTLTTRWVKARLEDVKRHMKGSKFQKRKGMFLKDDVELMDEPEELEQESSGDEFEGLEEFEDTEAVHMPDSLASGSSEASGREADGGTVMEEDRGADEHLSVGGACAETEVAGMVAGKDETTSRQPTLKRGPRLKRRKLC